MMKFIKRVFVVLTWMILLLGMPFSSAAFAQEIPYDDPLLARYTGPNGIEIISYHPEWTEQAKLKMVWDELMRNTHFEEIEYFKRVKIYRGNYNSMYRGGIEITTWSNGREERKFSKDNEIIYFPDPDQKEENGMAVTLAHEYGHHFTIYYLFKKENVDLHYNWQDSRYAKLRGLLDYKNTIDEENANHQWQPVEIAASDYVQFFGSPNARQIIYFEDQPSRSGTVRFSTAMYNIYPQENIYLPLAAQVPGLHEYWLGLAGQHVNGINHEPTVPLLAVTGKRYGEYSTPYLKFQWSRSLDDKDNPLIYTLLEYESLDDRLGQPIFVAPDRTSAERLLYPGESGIRYYRLLVADPERLIISSDFLMVDFDYPTFQSPPEDTVFRDVSTDFWAEEYIRQLTNREILQGYPDNSFKPGLRITRAEFAVILCKALKINPLSDNPGFTDTQDHWAGDYIAAVRKAGLIKGYSDNTFGPDRPISRAEAAAVLDKAINVTGIMAAERNKQESDELETDTSETDTPVAEPGMNLPDVGGHWAGEAIQRIVAESIMSGYPDGKFYPDKRLSRAEAAAVLIRVADISDG